MIEWPQPGGETVQVALEPVVLERGDLPQPFGEDVPTVPLAHETWFQHDEEAYDWGFLTDGTTLALLGAALLLTIGIRLINAWRDGVDVGWLAAMAPYMPFAIRMHLAVSLVGLLSLGLLPVAGDGPADRRRRHRARRGDGGRRDRHGDRLPDPGGGVAADRRGADRDARVRGRAGAAADRPARPRRLHPASPAPAAGRPTSSAAPCRTGSARTARSSREALEAVAKAILALRVAAGAALIIVALYEKLINPELALDFLAEHPDLQLAHQLGLPLSDLEFVRIAGAIEVLFGLLLISGALPQAIVLIAGIPFNATLWFFGINELVGHLPVYGAMLVMLVFGSHPQLRPLTYALGPAAAGGSQLGDRVLGRLGAELALAQDLAQAALQRHRDGGADGAVVEALDERLEEALDDEALRVGLAEAVRAEVVDLLGVDLGDRGGVGAADVVGLDLQSGDRVGVGRLREQQVAVVLEGVGLLGAGIDADHPAPDGGRRVVEDAAEGEVGGGVGGGVLLVRVVVQVLVALAGIGAGDAGARTLAGEAGVHPDLAAG